MGKGDHHHHVEAGGFPSVATGAGLCRYMIESPQLHAVGVHPQGVRDRRDADAGDGRSRLLRAGDPSVLCRAYSGGVRRLRGHHPRPHHR
jgi:hypothetical protein